MLISVSALLLS